MKSFTGLKMAFSICLLSFLLIGGPVAAEIDIKGEAAILVNASDGMVIHEKNSDKKWYPASMTKLMTLIIALEAEKNGQCSMNDKVVTSENAASYGGTQLYLEPGEEFTLDDMLKAVILGSANDASVAVAEHIAGTEEAFVELMNKKAKEIGAINTHFMNSHGLHHDDHYTTAKDMALIALYSLRYPETLEYTSLKYYEFREDPPTARYSLNKLLWWYPGADGLKTGTTTVAKRNLVATANRDGLRLISVVMGVDEQNGHFRESMKLLNYGFAKYSFKMFFEQGTILGKVRVDKGMVDLIDIVPQENIGLAILKGQDEGYETKINLVAYLPAPVNKGTYAGEVIILKEGQEIKKYELVAASDVPKGSFSRLLGKVFKKVFCV
ncbi:MAG: D-alanyl-D-alanine carboxypeptidase family protein [Bacillota bacterium]